MSVHSSLFEPLEPRRLNSFHLMARPRPSIGTWTRGQTRRFRRARSWLPPVSPPPGPRSFPSTAYRAPLPRRSALPGPRAHCETNALTLCGSSSSGGRHINPRNFSRGNAATAAARAGNSASPRRPCCLTGDIDLQADIQRRRVVRPLLRQAARRSSNDRPRAPRQNSATGRVLLDCRRPMKCQVRRLRSRAAASIFSSASWR